MSSGGRAAVPSASPGPLKMQKVGPITQWLMCPHSLSARLYNGAFNTILHLILATTGVIFPILLQTNYWLRKFELTYLHSHNYTEYEFMSA